MDSYLATVCTLQPSKITNIILFQHVKHHVGQTRTADRSDRIATSRSIGHQQVATIAEENSVLAAEKREQEERLLVEMFKKKYEECPKPRLSNAPQTSSQFAEGNVGR